MFEDQAKRALALLAIFQVLFERLPERRGK